MKAAVRIGILPLALALGPVHAARAEPPRVALRWNAPDDCPDDAELIHAVEDFLGQTLAEAREQQLSVTVNVAGTDGAFAAKLRFKGSGGVEERYLEHPECSKLMEASALLIALSIDPERVKARKQAPQRQAVPVVATPVAESPSPTSQPAPFTQPEPMHDEPAPTASHEPAVQTEAMRVRLDVFGLVGGGALPTVGPGLGADLALRRGHFEVGAIGHYWLPRSAAVPGSTSADIQLSLATLGAELCGLPWLGAWSLRGCAGAAAADLWGKGQGVEQPRTRHAFFPALTARLTFGYGRRRLSPFAGVEGMWALSQPPVGVIVNGRNLEVFRPNTGSVTGFVGLSYEL